MILKWSKFKGQGRLFHHLLLPMLWPLLWPLSLLYGAVVRLRHRAYDHGLKTEYQTPLPTLSIGGIEVGGCGKSQVASYLLSRLQSQGLTCGLLTRGYGRSATGLQVCDAKAVADPVLIGDEPAMLFEQCQGTLTVAACAKRITGARALHERGCDVAVMDDGFSHRGLSRHCNIVVMRGSAPFADGALLPLGRLREPVSSLNRADLIWLHFGRKSAALAWLRSPRPKWLTKLFLTNKTEWQSTHKKTPFIVSAIRVNEIDDLDGNKIPISDGQSLVAVTGIANPSRFLDTLLGLGIDVKEKYHFPDHHNYSADEITNLHRSLALCHAQALICTEKDLVKIAPLWRHLNFPSKQLYVAKIGLSVLYGEDNITAIITTVKDE